jgi:hypothetical protein
MTIKKYPAPKDPNSVIDYGREWGGIKGWLGETEEINVSNWIITCEDEEAPTLKINVALGFGIFPGGKDTFVWLEGGTIDLEYNLTNRITTNENRTEDRTGIITVTEK